MEDIDKLFRALSEPNWRNFTFVKHLYHKARIMRGHHQYKTLCNNYGIEIKELEQYRDNV